MAKLLKEGEGWRVGWDTAALEFKALLGADDWALELTEAEFEDFCRLADQLSTTMQQIATELMDEETIACELESDRVWIEAAGYANAYGLRVMLLSGRRSEGYWTAAAVPGLLHALQTVKGF